MFYCKKSKHTSWLIMLVVALGVNFGSSQNVIANSTDSHKIETKTSKAPADVQRVKADMSKKPVKKHSSKAAYGKSYFPNYELITEEGKKVKFFDDMIKDKVVSINFIFTSCQNICPLETARLTEVYKKLGDRVGKDVFMYSITVDPERDTPEVLKAYKKKFNIGKGWTFLTGKKEEIDDLRTKLGLYITDLDETLPDGQIDHNISLVMGNQKTGRWMKRSPYETSDVLATMLGDWLHNWKNNHNENPLVSADYKNAQGIQKFSDGAYIYKTRCLTCHTIGAGDKIGPDLQGVTSRREEKWLQRWIAKPNEMIKEKDPVVMEMMTRYKNITMPNLKLNESDVNKLITYIKSIEKENNTAASNN